MRCLILLLLAARMPILAGAQKRATVAQLDHLLHADLQAHKSDTVVVRQLGDVELTERLTEPTLERLEAQLTPGSQASIALQLLADESVFLEPPSSELPAIANPDAAAQQRMLTAARNYVAQTLPKLPNLLATRSTHRFDDTPQALKQGEWPVRAGLHLVDTSSSEISIRHEQDTQAPDAAAWQEQTGLTSGGEFGSTLALVLADATNGSVSWDHWESSTTGPDAVFRYTVPHAASHFEIIGSLQRQTPLEGRATPAGGSRGTAGISAVPSGTSSSSASIVRSRPGYHGSFWVDAATGAILRITMEADPKQSAPFRRAAMMVEYGPVEIGGSTFICPVRSLALSRAIANAQTITGDAPTQWLNETLFTDYHRFGSSVRILPEAARP